MGFEEVFWQEVLQKDPKGFLLGKEKIPSNYNPLTVKTTKRYNLYGKNIAVI